MFDFQSPTVNSFCKTYEKTEKSLSTCNVMYGILYCPFYQMYPIYNYTFRNEPLSPKSDAT